MAPFMFLPLWGSVGSQCFGVASFHEIVKIKGCLVRAMLDSAATMRCKDACALW